jgi:large subunit ribosomal protein L6
MVKKEGVKAKKPGKDEKSTLRYDIDVLNGLDVRREGEFIVIKGPKGELRRRFETPHITVKLADGKITLTSDTDKKKIKSIMGSWEAHLKNMMKGVTKGWNAELKLVYSHFPVKLKVESGVLYIENFLGERIARKVPIPSDVKIQINGASIVAEGLDKESVGQACARIEQATKIKGFDKRIFQDGLFIIRKPTLKGEDA